MRTRAEGCPPVLWGLGTRVFPGGWSHGHPLPSMNPNSRPPKSTETGVGTHCWGTANLSLRLWGRLGPSQHLSPDIAWAPQPIAFGGTAPWAPNPLPLFRAAVKTQQHGGRFCVTELLLSSYFRNPWLRLGALPCPSVVARVSHGVPKTKAGDPPRVLSPQPHNRQPSTRHCCSENPVTV